MKMLNGLAAMILLGGVSTAGAATNWTMVSGYPEESFLTRNLRQFISEVEKESKGELKIDLRSNDTLIKHDAIKRAVQSGQVPIGEIRLGVYGNESPMYILDSLPNIAADYEEATLLTEASKPFFDKLFAKNGMRIITYVAWPGQGFYTKSPATTVADFKGKKLRIYSAATQKMGDMLGFQSTILPFAEVPQAFSTGLIEALFTSAQTGVDTQAWDNVKYFTYTGTMHNKNAVIVNERAFRTLGKDVQKVLLDAGERATKRGWAMSKAANEEKVATLKANGIVVTDASPEIQAALQNVGKKMMEDWSSSAAPEERAVLDAYLKLKTAKPN
jgi:TRAP-type transport system periplasmic protein